MIKTIIFDLSRTLLFPKDRGYSEDINFLLLTLSPMKRNDFFWDWFVLNDQLIAF